MNDYTEMLSEMGISTSVRDILSESQRKALDMISSGKNVFIHGCAGTGKSFLIEYIRNNLKGKRIAVTATTGVSAYSIRGSTINRFTGIGTGENKADSLIKNVLKGPGKDNIRNIDTLVIDEISMMSAELFEKLDIIFKRLRGNTKALFGGIQLVVCGDMFQLLPVFSRNEKLYGQEQDKRLIIESAIFCKHFKKTTVYLEKNFRQQGDKVYNDMLQRLRYGELLESDEYILNDRVGIPCEENTLHLVSSNVMANKINQDKLAELEEDMVIFEAKYSNNRGSEPRVHELLLTDLKYQFSQKGLERLVLKKGCKVMLVKNIDTDAGLVNGAIGVVLDITTSVQVKFDNGVTKSIAACEWKLEHGDTSVTAIQFPLIVAYALTIHKSQSLTLDKVVIDLGDSIFCHHQTYVALSRVKSLDGVFLTGFNPKKIKVSNIVVDYMRVI